MDCYGWINYVFIYYTWGMNNGWLLVTPPNVTGFGISSPKAKEIDSHFPNKVELNNCL